MKKYKIINVGILLSIILGLMPPFAYADNIKSIDFNSEAFSVPEALSGEWELVTTPPVVREENDFSKNQGNFTPIYGQWSIENGKYRQSELSTGAAARAVLPDSYTAFDMSFDVTPLSDNTLLMLFFGCTSSYNVCMAQISSEASKIVVGENEYVGEGGLEKGIAQSIRMTYENGNAVLYLNEKQILSCEGLVVPEGQIGIGCWNSLSEFDNFKVIAPDNGGAGKKLMQSGDKFSYILLEQDCDSDMLYADISVSDLIHGTAGISLCADNEGNSYMLGINNSKAYIKLKNNGILKTLAECDYEAQSGKYNRFFAELDGNSITFGINSEKLLTAADSTLTSDGVALFCEKTPMYCSMVQFADNDNGYSDDAVLSDEIYSFTDISPEYKKACETLSALGIIKGYSDKTFRGQLPLTRAEFSDILYKMRDILPYEYPTGTLLSDIDDDSPYKKSAQGAVNEGLMSAPDRKFSPDEQINTTDAASALLKILGIYHSEKSINHLANQYGLFEKVKSNDGLLDRENTAKLIYNAMSCERYDFSQYYEGKLKSEKTSSLFKDVFSVSEIIGTIDKTAVGNAVSDTETKLSENEISVNGITLEAPAGCNSLLGEKMVITAVISKDGYTGRVLYISPYQKAKITKINSRQITAAAPSYIEYSRFEDSKKSAKINIPADCPIIYNNQYYMMAKTLPDNFFNISNGTITVIDNDGDSKPEYIKADEYTTYVVDTVSATNYTVYSKNGKAPLMLNPDLKNVVIYKSGAKISINEIHSLDILSVQNTKSSNGYITVTVSDKVPLAGTIKGIGKNTLTIGRDQYFTDSEIDISKISFSDFVTVYFDFKNTICHIQNSISDDYAYVTGATYSEDDERLYIKLFTFENGYGNFPCAESINVYTSNTAKTKYNEKNIYALKELITSLAMSSKTVDQSGNTLKYGELIKYKMNSENQICEIRMYSDRTNRDLPDGRDIFSKYYDSKISGENAYYYQGLANSKFRIDSSTKILSLPEGCTDFEDFRFIPYSDLSWDEYYDMRIYDVSEEFKAGAVLVYNYTKAYNMPACIVSKVSYIVDEKDNNCIAIEMYKNGELTVEKSLEPDLCCDLDATKWFGGEGTQLSDLKAGDIITAETDAKGYITSFKLIFKNKHQDYFATSPRGWYWGVIPSTQMTLCYTPITKRTGDIYVFNINNYSRPVTKNNANYYIFEKNKIKPASFEDIKTGDNAVMIWKTMVLNTVIILR